MKVITLSGRRQGDCLVDNKDFERLSQYKWHMDSKGYAYRNVMVDGKRTTRRMHHDVFGDGFVDHKNGNKLDNRSRNLRPSNKSCNAMNAKAKTHYGGKRRPSQYKGISQKRLSNGLVRWRMTIKVGDKTYDKLYTSEIEAARAYDDYAKKYFGEYARLNFEMRQASVPAAASSASVV